MSGGAGGGGFRGSRCSGRKQHGKTPMRNQAQNRQTDAVASKLKLTPTEREELHHLVGNQGWDYQEILEEAKIWFNK